MGQASSSPHENRRVLIIDDTRAIHNDFRKILVAPANSSDTLDAAERLLMGEPKETTKTVRFEVDSAYQGDTGLGLVQRANEEGKPYAVAFVDVRMPPGWDGIETTERIWRVDPNIQVVICTAYSDYSWEEMVRRLGQSDRLVVLKKPFDNIEVRQLAYALTDKWALLQEKQSRLDELDTKVRQRTSELERANEKLREEMAERLRVEKELRHSQKLEALGQLTAGIGHEINNPLCYVTSNLDFIQRELPALEEELPEGRLTELYEVVGEAILGSNRITEIVRDIRRFARKNDFTHGSVDVHEALETAVKMVGNEIRHRARLVREFEEVPQVVGDAQRLEQVVVNLLINATHAVGNEQADKQEIRVATFMAPSGLVVIEVQDTGCGIAEENIERVFDPFFTTKSVGVGTGLGLSTCHGIVTSLGGEITIESREGEGTTVRVFLPPAVTAQAEATEPATISGERRGAGKATLPNRILLVDDDPLVLKSAQRLFDGHDVRSAQNVRDALALYKTEAFDLVFCDLMMPEASGQDLFEEFSRLGEEHADRVIFVTGGAFTPQAIEFLASTSNRCLEKPLVREEVLRVIEEHGRSASAAEPPSR